jgi:hypothetical protein
MSSFFNSIVRGAGMSIGRNLVGNFGRRNSNSNTKRKSKINTKLIESIKRHKEGLLKYNQFKIETEESFKNGSLSEMEYNILIEEVNLGIKKTELYLATHTGEETTIGDIEISRILNWKGKITSFLLWIFIGMIFGQVFQQLNLEDKFNYFLIVWISIGWMIPIRLVKSIQVLTKPSTN